MSGHPFVCRSCAQSGIVPKRQNTFSPPDSPSMPSTDIRTLVVGRTQSSFGDRTFAAAALRLWNSLLSDIRQPDLCYGQFRRSLKTFLFYRATHFSAKRGIAIACRLSVRPSVTLVNCSNDQVQFPEQKISTLKSCSA